jgi:hypothetical protein
VANGEESMARELTWHHLEIPGGLRCHVNIPVNIRRINYKKIMKIWKIFFQVMFSGRGPKHVFARKPRKKV